MDIGSQILVVLIFILLLLSILYFVKKNTEKIKTITLGGATLIDVQETRRIDTYHRLTLVKVSEKEFLLLTSKNGTSVIQQII
jgi:flagellar biogenesis protein FliO